VTRYMKMYHKSAHSFAGKRNKGVVLDPDFTLQKDRN